MTNGSVAEVIMRPPFNNIPSGAGRPEVVYRGTGLIYDGRGYGYSTGTSCDTYCHSDGRGGLGKRNYANTLDLVQSPMTSVLRWTGRAAACGDCHNKAADDPNSQHTTWSKPHNKHANTYGNGGTIGSNNTSTNNTLVTCAACHASTTTSNTALLSGSRAKHPNGFRNISASSTVGSAAFRWDAGNNQCKNGYCHSRAYSFTDYSTPWIKWDTVQANVHCGSCHTAYPTGPDYQNGYKGKANSHPKHAVFWGFTCDWCHNGTVGSGGNTISSVRNHVNKNYNVVANGTKTFIGLPNTFTPTSANPPTTKTSCSNVNCHGGNASRVFTWGGTNKCGDCHFATADTVNYAFKNSTMRRLPGRNGTGLVMENNPAATMLPGQPLPDSHRLQPRLVGQAIHACTATNTTVSAMGIQITPCACAISIIPPGARTASVWSATPPSVRLALFREPATQQRRQVAR
ncbi:CxxxxCH/CxxCH domain c-type cytochrome [Geotalea toluenoxydans]|uniref:CxxxxCH/CxxCH domain c-type cytochrome n=1 Tax=Geotalea toluenoxydans TaxID=421624 RepID=UPI000AE60D1A|nr:CxxxxCH/CxxCH domain-containing protein [Geotalea toluenoxydans]